MTTSKLGVTISVDLDASSVTIRPVGTLTTRNLHGLVALRHGAERALPHCAVSLDRRFIAYESDESRHALEHSGLVPQPVRTRHVQGSPPAPRQAP